MASGVRRIEAVTGKASLAGMQRLQERLNQAAAALKVRPTELESRAESIMGEVKALHQTVEKLKARETAGETERLLFSTRELGGLRVLTAAVPDADAVRLRQMGDMLRDKAPNIVAVLASSSGGKVTFLAVCGADAVKAGVKAGELVREVSAVTGGKGGGKPESAMGGGTDLVKTDNALAVVDDFVEKKLGL